MWINIMHFIGLVIAITAISFLIEDIIAAAIQKSKKEATL